ncbi:hypothetical protein [Tessaracoccus sp. Z1128]
MSAGVEVLDHGQVLEVRLPSWLTDDERQAIVEEVRRFIAEQVEAVLGR